MIFVTLSDKMGLIDFPLLWQLIYTQLQEMELKQSLNLVGSEVLANSSPFTKMLYTVVHQEEMLQSQSPYSKLP